MCADEEAWYSLSKNAYGAFVHVGLQSGVVKAVEMCGSMLVVSCGIQLVIALQLYFEHQAEVAAVQQALCDIPFTLQMSAVMIFVTMMFNHLSEMWRQAHIIAAATHHLGGNGGKIGELESISDSEEEEPAAPELRLVITAGTSKRAVLLILGVLSEVITWAAILMAGVLWIVTSPTVDLVIRSTVAVMFVLNVDEIIYQSCCPASIMEDVEETRYRVPNIFRAGSLKHSDHHRRWVRVIEHYFYIYVYLLMLLGLAGLLSFLLRGASECSEFRLW